MNDYCEHGTYVGNWAGPDYMCGLCEMGISVEEAEYGSHVQAVDYRRRQLQQQADWAKLTAEHMVLHGGIAPDRIAQLATEAVAMREALARAEAALAAWLEDHPQYA